MTRGSNRGDVADLEQTLWTGHGGGNVFYFGRLHQCCSLRRPARKQLGKAEDRRKY